MIAKSSNVLGKAVTGTPSRTARSSVATIDEKWTLNRRFARRRVGAVTCIVSGR